METVKGKFTKHQCAFWNERVNHHICQNINNKSETKQKTLAHPSPNKYTSGDLTFYKIAQNPVTLNHHVSPTDNHMQMTHLPLIWHRNIIRPFQKWFCPLQKYVHKVNHLILIDRRGQPNRISSFSALMRRNRLNATFFLFFFYKKTTQAIQDTNKAKLDSVETIHRPSLERT